MITNTGKAILGKYIIGQAPSFASHIAIGCGAKPLHLEANLAAQDYSTKTELDFEMFRVPIISSGYITEGGQSKIAFTAELPSIERYGITEIGVYSAGSNQLALGSNSKVLYNFGADEGWAFHTSTGTSDILQVPSISGETSGEISPDNDVLILSAGDFLFDNQDRMSALEKPRFMDQTVAIRGNVSSIANVNTTSGELEISNVSSHIHITGQTLNFQNNSVNDELKVTFSLLKEAESQDYPEDVYVVLEFSSAEEGLNSQEYAKMQIHVTQAEFESEKSYITRTATLGGTKPVDDIYTDSLFQTSGFSWKTASVVKVYAAVVPPAGSTSSQYIIALDGLRFENKSSLDYSPLYGLVAYSVVKNNVPGVPSNSTDSYPIEKNPNSNNLVEFRFGLDV